MAQDIRKIDDMEILLERRRYPGRTFTWASVRGPDGNWISLGDPWPCITPKYSELSAAARNVLGEKPAPTLADQGYRI